MLSSKYDFQLIFPFHDVKNQHVNRRVQLTPHLTVPPIAELHEQLGVAVQNLGQSSSHVVRITNFEEN